MGQITWWEHAEMVEENRIPNEILNYGSRGKRNFGRRIKRWSDQNMFLWARSRILCLKLMMMTKSKVTNQRRCVITRITSTFRVYFNASPMRSFIYCMKCTRNWEVFLQITSPKPPNIFRSNFVGELQYNLSGNFPFGP
jgi:hypothetical protein